ncbi:MAG: AAA family ATPase [Bacteroides sp.]|nr:AAA family ATPase [Bacteroides sp.]
MVNTYLGQQIKTNFPYKPTFEQENVVKILADFLFCRKMDVLFLLKGYAGTGKTSLIGALVKTLDQLEQKCVLLAPTGRAAKVFSHYAGHPAYTIHKKIYRQKTFSNEMDNFSINDNLHQHTLFIVDEASMIANDGLSGSMFGTGRLLDDLIQYVYSGQGCRLMLIGDLAQLLPVGEEESPALSADVLKGYGLEVHEAMLTEVVRQLSDSGILWNATELRRYISEEDFFTLPMVKVDGFPDVKVIPGNELIEAIGDSYDRVGMDETIVVCRSNKRANIYNKGIRNTILYREEELETGDLLMVAKNNYFWTEGCKELDFIANGEIAEVRRVRREREMYGFRFADVVLRFPDYDELELEVTVLLDTLHTESPALPKEMNDKLFYAVLEDYSDITIKRERMKKMKSDPYYNALQVKYAYAVTCHKAQGGQWKRVFLDQGYMTEDMLSPDYFRWLYTAFTRATETLYLVNWPKEQME